MANLILLKRNSTQDAVPTTGDLELGELAVNTYDGKVFTKKNDGSDEVVEVGDRKILYGTGTPPSPTGLAEGTLYFQYEV